MAAFLNNFLEIYSQNPYFMNSYLGFWRVTRKQFNIRRYAEHKCYTKVCILFLFGPLQNSCVQMWWIFPLLVYTNLGNSYSKCILFRIIFFILNSSSNKKFRHENSTKKSGQQNHRVRWLTSSKTRIWLVFSFMTYSLSNIYVWEFINTKASILSVNLQLKFNNS